MKHIYSIISLLVLFTISNSIWGQNIIGYDPGQNVSGVDSNQDLVLTFDVPISFNTNPPVPSTKKISLYNSDLGTEVDTWEFALGSVLVGVATGNGTNTLTLDPNIILETGTNYHIIIEDGAIQGFSGIDNTTGNNWRFSTSASLTYNPLQDAIDVSLIQDMTLTFPTNISFNSSTDTKYIRLFDESGEIESWWINSGYFASGISIESSLLRINPTANLQEGLNYYIIIEDGAIDGFTGIDNSAGNNWRFTAITYPPNPETYSPLPNISDVSVNPILQLTFDRNVQFITPAVEYNILLRQGGTTIDNFPVSPGFTDGNLQFDGVSYTTDRLTITPYTTLDINTEYHIIIPGGLIESESGAPFAGILTSTGWNFTTIAQPVWASGYPYADEGTMTLDNINIVGQTNKDGTYIYVVTATSDIPTVDQIKGGIVPGAIVTNQGTPGTMDEDGDFTIPIDISDEGTYIPETTYYVYLVGTDGGNGLDSDIGSTSFTTLERNAPVTSFNPADGANEVSILTNVVISFDEPVRMTNGTIIDNSNVESLITFELNPANPVAFSATIDATKQIITITPDAPLNDNSGYDVNIFAVEDYHGNQQSSSSQASFNTAKVVTWLGGHAGSETDWNTNQNWDGNFNPGSSVLIPAGVTYMPLISTDVIVGNINIVAGASVEINSTGSLVINETLTMGSLTTGLGNASLIDNGSTPVSVDPTKVAIYQNIVASTRSYHVSSPITDANKTNMGVDNAIYEFDNTTDGWRLLGDTEDLSIGTGYVLRSSSNVTFTGNLNQNSSYAVPLTRTDGAGYGWNLVGNPYTAALNWDHATISKNNIDDAYWIFLNDDINYGIYATYSSALKSGTHGLDNLIPTHQGYFAKVTIGSPTGSVTMRKSALAANNKSILKGATNDSQPQIKLAGVNGEYIDETIIGFVDIADNTKDHYDASKKFGTNNNYIQIYSYEDSDSYAINCKQEISDGLIVPIGFKTYNEGTFKIRKLSSEGISDGYDVFLEDKYEDGLLVNLEEQEEYEFTTAQTGNVVDRFALHFALKVTTDINTPNTDQVLIYSNDKTIFINGTNLNGKTYEIYSLNGTIIDNGVLQKNGLNTININREGLFIVRVYNDNDPISKKILLK